MHSHVSKVPAGGRTALQGVAARTAVPEQPTTVYVGCGVLYVEALGCVSWLLVSAPPTE